VIIAMVVVAVIVSMTSIKLSEKGFLFAPTTPSSGGGGGGGGGSTSSGVVVYTTKEIDEKLGALKGSCQYVDRKDSIYGPLDGLNIMQICQKFKYIPKIVVRKETTALFNAIECPMSYAVYTKDSDTLMSYKTELSNIKLIDNSGGAGCRNVRFPNGNLNGNFSIGITGVYSGVLCCNN